MDLSVLIHPEPYPEDVDPAVREADRRLASERTARNRIFQETFLAGIRENIGAEDAMALDSRLLDAEQVWRYFCRRDEMNAETHLGDSPVSTEGGRFARVRYSPITIASERVVGWLAKLYYGRDVDYRTAMVETGEGGVPVAVAWTEHRKPRPERPNPVSDDSI